MKQIIKTTAPETYPEGIKQLFSSHATEYKEYKSIDDISFPEGFWECAYQLYKDSFIVAYHYTREISPGYFKQHGLHILNFERHKQFVVNALQDRLPSSQLEFLKNLSFPETRAHDTNSIWFCYQRNDSDAGVIPLLKYFGGECICGRITDGYIKDDISNALEQVGTPMVVEFCCNACDISNSNVTCNVNITRIMLATYLNKYFCPEMRIPNGEDSTEKDIPPTQIIDVCPVEVLQATKNT